MMRTLICLLCSACSTVGSYTTEHGATFHGNTSWMPRAEAELQERQAADILSSATGLSAERLLQGLDGVQGYGLDVASFACGTLAGVVGCTYTTRPAVIEVAERHGLCAHQYADWRHEVAHAMLDAASLPDSDHKLPIWYKLDEWTLLCE